ncbi:hypothetical protein C0583_02295 [Candidatus Parcubacteria bacterium]|nr:MAG: hypothetical protein C0583_02295 [Candidatus Parcubacteria bacterium]
MDNQKTILIVEDEKAIQGAFKKGFESYGYNVMTADNGKEGLELIESIGPDLVILDILMPEMNGEEVLEAMHKKGLTENIPVLVVSNKSDGVSLFKCKKLGAKEYLIKVNVTLDELHEKVKQYLS